MKMALSCPICGKPRGFFAVLFEGARHPACIRQREEEKKRAFEAMKAQIEKGEFKNLNDQADVLLDPKETCLVIIRGCSRALFYPVLVGKLVHHPLSTESRSDGLERKDSGTLYVTDRRILFVGQGGSNVIALKKVLQCSVNRDALSIAIEGRSAASYFILEAGPTIEIAEKTIMKLASLIRSGAQITIRD